MKKFAALILLAAFLAASAASQPDQNVDPGIAPGNPFFAVESFVEDLEVGLAGAIGGPDMKSKALANNAEESLAEAEKLAERNKSQQAARMVNRYEEKMNRSRELAGNDQNLTERLENISRNNVQRLEEVKQKVPEEAQKGIQNAIDNAGKIGRTRNRSEIPGPGRPEREDTRPDKGKTDKGRNVQNATDSSIRQESPEAGNRTEKAKEKSEEAFEDVNRTMDDAEETVEDSQEKVVENDSSENEGPENPVTSGNSLP